MQAKHIDNKLSGISELSASMVWPAGACAWAWRRPHASVVGAAVCMGGRARHVGRWAHSRGALTQTEILVLQTLLDLLLASGTRQRYPIDAER